MTRYDTSAQRDAARTRRLWGLVGTVVLLVLAVWYLRIFVAYGANTYYTAASFSLALAIFLLVLTIVPLSLVIGNRPHPSAVEVMASGLTLSYPEGREDRRSWDTGPLDTALDTRDAPPGRRRPHGTEVTVWVNMPGREEHTNAVRPVMMVLSGEAFDEVRRYVLSAGYEERVDAVRRAGTYYRYEKPPVPVPD